MKQIGDSLAAEEYLQQINDICTLKGLNVKTPFGFASSVH